MAKNKIVIQSSKNEQLYVKVIAKNNKTIAVTETYKTLAGANKAASALKKIVSDSEIIDKSKKKGS